MPLHITRHAIERFQERVSNVTEEAARLALSSPAIALAASFGAPYVRLGSGHRVVIEKGAVVTILPSDCPAWRLGTRKEVS